MGGVRSQVSESPSIGSGSLSGLDTMHDLSLVDSEHLRPPVFFLFLPPTAS